MAAYRPGLARDVTLNQGSQTCGQREGPMRPENVNKIEDFFEFINILPTSFNI